MSLGTLNNLHSADDTANARALVCPRFVQVNSSFCQKISYYPYPNHQHEKINWKAIQVQAMWQNFPEKPSFR